MRIRHVINSVGASAPPALRETQGVTLTSIRNAMDHCEHHPAIDVEVVASRYPDEQLPAHWLIDAPCLTTSASDLWGFDAGPRLPLLREILEPLDAHYDVAVYTNIDIILVPEFYVRIFELVTSGIDAINITRRDLLIDAEDFAFETMRTAPAARHPGSDCFVFSRALADDLELDSICIGLPPIGRVLSGNLWLKASNYKRLTESFLTFHIGSDRDWDTSPVKAMMTIKNREAGMRALRALALIHGRHRVDRFIRESRDSSDRPRNRSLTRSSRRIAWRILRRLRLVPSLI